MVHTNSTNPLSIVESNGWDNLPSSWLCMRKLGRFSRVEPNWRFYGQSLDVSQLWNWTWIYNFYFVSDLKSMNAKGGSFRGSLETGHPAKEALCHGEGRGGHQERDIHDNLFVYKLTSVLCSVDTLLHVVNGLTCNRLFCLAIPQCCWG